MHWHLLWQIPVAILVCAIAGRFIGALVWGLVRKSLRPRDRLSCLGLVGTVYACCGEDRMCGVSASGQADQPAGLVEVASQVVDTEGARVWITIFRDEERQAWVYLAVASNEAVSLSVVPDADAGR